MLSFVRYYVRQLLLLNQSDRQGVVRNGVPLEHDRGGGALRGELHDQVLEERPPAYLNGGEVEVDVAYLEVLYRRLLARENLVAHVELHVLRNLNVPRALPLLERNRGVRRVHQIALKYHLAPLVAPPHVRRNGNLSLKFFL